MSLITLKQLVKHDACADQRKLFESTFGTSVDLTEALAEQYAQTFGFGWAACNLLSPSAWADYRRVVGPAFARLYNAER